MMQTTHKQRILHVDDESDTSIVVRNILENAGFEIVSVNSGTSALKSIKLDGFDLIILDIMMPDMSGWELFSRIGRIKSNYKVIFLSVLELSKEKLLQLQKAGVVDYIQKPFDRDDFVKRIKRALEK